MTTTTTHTGTVMTPRLPAGLSVEQVDAHLGVGVPAGWVPVDDGDARVFVPSDWMFLVRPQGNPVICTSSAPGVISLGSIPFAGCRSLIPSSLPSQMIAIVPPSHTYPGQPSITIHGYRVYNDTSPIRYSIAAYIYDVPQLNMSIASYGTLSSRVLDTIAPSARKVALAFANEAVPNGWHAITKDGVSLSIPPSWSVSTLAVSCGNTASDSGLFLVPAILTPCGSCICGPTGPPTIPPNQNGVSLYETAHNYYAPSPTGASIATLHHGPTTITIHQEANSPLTLDLFVRKAGSTITHILTLVLDREGRVAGGVLASIRATT